MTKWEFSLLNHNVGHNKNKLDALIALSSLGFDKKNAEKAIEKVCIGDETVEQLIKAALKIL